METIEVWSEWSRIARRANFVELPEPISINRRGRLIARKEVQAYGIEGGERVIGP